MRSPFAVASGSKPTEPSGSVGGDSFEGDRGRDTDNRSLLAGIRADYRWSIGSLILGLIRQFAQGSNGAPGAVVGVIGIEPNRVHEPFPRTAVGGFP